MLFAFVIGAIGNLVGTAIAGTDLVWDVFAEGVNIVLGSLLCLLTGTMLGMLIRSSAAALVAYFVYAPAAHRRRHPGLQPSGSGTCSPGWTSTTPRPPCSKAP